MAHHLGGNSSRGGTSSMYGGGSGSAQQVPVSPSTSAGSSGIKREPTTLARGGGRNIRCAGGKPMHHSHEEEKYLALRKRNNIAVRKSREKQRAKQNDVINTLSSLRCENSDLHSTVAARIRELNLLNSLLKQVNHDPPERLSQILDHYNLEQQQQQQNQVVQHQVPGNRRTSGPGPSSSVASMSSNSSPSAQHHHQPPTGSSSAAVRLISSTAYTGQRFSGSGSVQPSTSSRHPGLSHQHLHQQPSIGIHGHQLHAGPSQGGYPPHFAAAAAAAVANAGYHHHHPQPTNDMAPRAMSYNYNSYGFE